MAGDGADVLPSATEANAPVSATASSSAPGQKATPDHDGTADVDVPENARRTLFGALCTNAVFLLLAFAAEAVMAVAAERDIDWEALGVGLLSSTLLGWVIHTLVFVLMRRVLLKRFVGFSAEEIAEIETPRMHLPHEWLNSLLEDPKKRWRVRVVDAAIRKGGHVYSGVGALFVTFHFLMKSDGLFELLLAYTLKIALRASIQTCLLWLYHGAEHASKWQFFSFAFAGADRIRDGRSAHINRITSWVSSLWGLIVAYLIAYSVLPPIQEDGNIWMLALDAAMAPVIFGDACGELVGGPFGRHTFEVKGFGEINKKSYEGCFAVFLGSLMSMPLLALSPTNPPVGTWLALPCVLAVITTITETASFRGTDNFTIPVINMVTLAAWYKVFGLL